MSYQPKYDSKGRLVTGERVRVDTPSPQHPHHPWHGAIGQIVGEVGEGHMVVRKDSGKQIITHHTNLVKEEKINELSNTMLKSYIRKAASDSATHAVDYGRSLTNPKKVDMGSFNKLVKRQVGITTATQHMKNEETKPNTLQVIREAVHKKAHARHQAITRILTKHKNGVIDQATANAQLKSGGHPGLNKEETINETLPANATAADYIHDFVHSKNSRFAGKSKAERIRQALGAYYSKRKR